MCTASERGRECVLVCATWIPVLLLLLICTCRILHFHSCMSRVLGMLRVKMQSVQSKSNQFYSFINFFSCCTFNGNVSVRLHKPFEFIETFTIATRSARADYTCKMHFICFHSSKWKMCVCACFFLLVILSNIVFTVWKSNIAAQSMSICWKLFTENAVWIQYNKFLLLEWFYCWNGHEFLAHRRFNTVFLSTGQRKKRDYKKNAKHSNSMNIHHENASMTKQSNRKFQW